MAVDCFMEAAKSIESTERPASACRWVWHCEAKGAAVGEAFACVLWVLAPPWLAKGSKEGRAATEDFSYSTVICELAK